MSSEKIIGRLRKLIKLGASPNEHEAQNALAQAAKLAAEYHLDLASIDTEDDSHKLGKRSSDVVLWGRRQRKYRWQLAHVVAQAWGCAPWTTSRLTIDFEPGHAPSESDVERVFSTYLATHRGLKRGTSYAIDTGPKPSLKLTSVFGRVASEYYVNEFPGAIGARTTAHLAMFGRRGAAEAAIYVYHVLLQCVDDLAKQVAQGRAGINSARWGLVCGLDERLARELADDDAPLDGPTFASEVKSTAVVLTEASDEAERFLNDNYGDGSAYSGGSSLDVSDPASFRAGRNAAADIEIPDPASGRASLGGSAALPAGADRQLG